MTAAAAAPLCVGPQAVVCLGVLGALTLGAGALMMRPSSKDVDSAGRTGGKDLAGSDAQSCTGQCAEDCARLSQQIESQAMALQRRLEDLVEDQHELYDTARGLADDAGNGTWQGHINRYQRERNELKANIALADSKKCPVSDFAREVAGEDPPQRPGYR